ncbi:phosphatase PAP2 family protein [Vagococcus vulneris]|nr:phosphatase PAP2 family protein [Vagococcus vulneris]
MKTHTKGWQIAGITALLGFILLATAVIINERMLTIIDQPIIQIVRGTITPDKTRFFKAMTFFGNTPTIVILTILSFLSLYKWKNKTMAFWLLLNSAIIQGIGNVALKAVFNRPRPAVEHLVYASSTSFPSGHSMGSMLFYGTIILLLPRLVAKKSIRICLQFVLAAIILLVGTSRIYLGVHYPTDVIGGFLVGLTWLCFSYPIFSKKNSLTLTEGSD